MRRATIVILLCSVSSASAAPFDMAYQGRLLDSSGVPIEGDHLLVLTLHGAASSHTGETFGNVPFRGGYFSVTLSDVDSEWLTAPLSVGISVDGQTELTPRSPLTTAPHRPTKSICPGLARNAETGALTIGDFHDH